MRLAQILSNADSERSHDSLQDKGSSRCVSALLVSDTIARFATAHISSGNCHLGNIARCQAYILPQGTALGQIRGDVLPACCR